MATNYAGRLPGGGPWRILPHCPGMLHNTGGAATRGNREHRCICPRALVIAKLGGRVPETKTYRPRAPEVVLFAGKVRSLPGAAACNTEEGRRTADQVWERADGSVARMRKYFCGRCPVSQECLAGAVERGEDSGMWGGKTSEQLRKLVKKARDAGLVNA